MFDPTLPQEGTPLDAVQMRSQLNGLKTLIDAILTLTAAQVDGVTTLLPGTPASATANVNGSTLHFTFGIPQGTPGLPFANAVVDAVNTLPAGTAATVGVSFDGTDVRFVFGIPQGAEGAPGAPGEVSNAALDAAISGTSHNSNAVSTLGLPVSDPPTQGELQTVANKLDELITALRR